jgi:hypothetical protein
MYVGVVPFQRREDGVGLSRQPWLQVRADPSQALWMDLPQQGIGRVPQILRGMCHSTLAILPKMRYQGK